MRFPQRSAQEVALRRSLLAGRRWAAADADPAWSSFTLRLLLEGGDAVGNHEASSSSRALAVQTRHGVLLLDDDALLHAMTGCPLATAPDAATRAALLRWAAADSPPALTAVWGGAWHPLAPTLAPTAVAAMPKPTAAALFTAHARDGSACTTRVRAAPQTLLTWAQSPGWAPLPPAGPLPAFLARIRPDGGMWLGGVRLTRAQLSALRSGDALWLPPNGREKTGPLSLIAGSRLVHLGQIDRASCEFLGWGLGGTPPSNPHQAFPFPTEPRPVDALTVDLDFIVGRLAMTVSDLCALSTGQVVPLDALTPAQVRIVAHGTELGRGQLVDVEGRMAVEILEWGCPR